MSQIGPDVEEAWSPASVAPPSGRQVDCDSPPPGGTTTIHVN